MFRIFRHYIPVTLLLLAAAETLILLVAVYLGAASVVALDANANPAAPTGTFPLWVKAIAFCLAMLAGLIATGFYRHHERNGPGTTLIRLSVSFVVGLMLMALLGRWLPQLMVGNVAYAVALVSAFIGIAICRLLCATTTAALFARRVLILGIGERAHQIENLRLHSDCGGITLVGFIDLGLDARVVSDSKIIRPQNSLRETARRFAATEIVVAIDDRRNGLPLNEILDCKMHGIRIIEEAEFLERQLGKIRLDAVHPSNVIYADGFTQAVREKIGKRTLDLVLATLLTALTLPLMVVTALAIAIESDGPVIYRQRRVGLRGEIMEIYKFRSMISNAEPGGTAVWAGQNDARVTKIGAVIRKFRIDELPQLFNVLKGNMSFIGPRPERPEFVAELVRAVPYYDLRHAVKPGITGWAQVSYPYGASFDDSREKLQYDLYYLKNYSAFLDLNILLQTVQVVLWRKGAR